MKLKKMVATFCTAAMLFTFSGCDKSLDLSLNVKKGDKYTTHIVNNQQTTVTANGQEVKTNQLTDMNLAMDIKDVDKDKNVTIDYKYDSMKVTTEASGSKIEYDSKNNDSSNPFNAIYGGIIGKSFTVKLDNKGKVLEVKGVDEIIKSVVDKIPGDNAQKQAFKDVLNKSFGNDAIKTMVNQTMNYYPQKNIKQGDTWESKYDMDLMFPINVDNKWKYAGEKNGILNVEVQSTISADTKDKPIDFMGVKAKAKLNGDCKGTIDIDKNNGLVQKGSMTENISGDMEMSVSDASTENIKMPMKINAKITYETTKK